MFKYQYYIIKHKEIAKYKENGLLSPVDMVGDNWWNWNVNMASIQSKSSKCLGNKGKWATRLIYTLPERW